jgi:hypothetical protein
MTVDIVNETSLSKHNIIMKLKMSANSPASSIYRSLINSLSSYIYPDIFF